MGFLTTEFPLTSQHHGCYPPGLDGKTPLLKTVAAWAIEQRKFKFMQTWKLLRYCTVFIELEGAMWPAGGEKASSITPRHEPFKLQWCLAWKDSSNSAIVAWTSWDQPTTFWLDLSPISLDEIHTWHHYQVKNFWLDNPEVLGDNQLPLHC